MALRILLSERSFVKSVFSKPTRVELCKTENAHLAGTVCVETLFNSNRKRAPMKAVLFSSNRDRVKLQDGGYLYVFDKLSSDGEKKFWRCERKSECHARIHTDAKTNEVLKRTSDHNHPFSMRSLKSCAMRTAKRLAQEFSADNVSSATGGSETGSGRTGHCVQNLAVLSSGPRRSPTSARVPVVLSEGSQLDTSDGAAESSSHLITQYAAASIDTGIEGIYSPPKSPTNEIDKLMAGGLVTWCPEIQEIIYLGEVIGKTVTQSTTKKFASLLLTGARNTGKSCLAALIAKHSGISTVRLLSPDDFIGFTENAKVLAVRNAFEEAYKAESIVIILDDIDRLVEHCCVGSRFSNTVLQGLLSVLKKMPPQDHRVFIIGTSEEFCATDLNLKSFFTSVAKVPLLSQLEHLLAVIQDSNIFNPAELMVLRDYFDNNLERPLTSYMIGIKSLLDKLELVKHCDPASRIPFLCSQLKR